VPKSVELVNDGAVGGKRLVYVDAAELTEVFIVEGIYKS
jgi:hypothetical protein